MRCPHFDAGRCRSCTFMGEPYGSQLERKQASAQAALGSDLHWDSPFSGPEQAFRNKAKLVVAGTSGAVALGILDDAGRGVDLQTCGLYEPGLSAAFAPLADLVNRLQIPPYDVPGRRGELKYLIVTHSPSGELMIRFVLRSTRHVDRLAARIPDLMARLPSVRVVSVNLHPEHRAVLEGDQELLLTREELLPMPVNDVSLLLAPNSFFQTNTLVAAALYRQARQWLSELAPQTLWDLYCGVGGFALHAATAEHSPRLTTGVEISQRAIDSAKASARRAGVADRTRFLAGDATTLLREEAGPEGIVVNPPRRGIGSLTAQLDSSQARVLLYSSCNVTSLAKDLAAMPSWKPVRARLFDMFPQTAHSEVLLLAVR